MAEYQWPKQGTMKLVGSDQSRIDGLQKATGAAKYAYDMTPPKMLLARMLSSPHAHAKIKSLDLEPAKKVPGVVAVIAGETNDGLKKAGDEVRWQGELIAVVAGESEGAVAEGLKAIKIEYDVSDDVFVNEENLAAAEKAGRTGPAGGNVQLENEAGDDDDEDEFAEKEIQRLLKESAVVVDGYYGIHVITHMCLEPHGSTCEWHGDKLLAHLSTQNVSGTAAQFATPLNIAASDVTVHCDFIGGGFGSKFAADFWGVAAAQISKSTGRPVKLMLDRDQELENAGSRPSGFIKVKLGADKNGVVKVWDSNHWGTNGLAGAPISQAVVPYVFNPPNRRRTVTKVSTNTAPVRAWRAPNHPQGCAITQVAYDDIAAKLGIDSYDVFMRNLPSTGEKAEVYADQLKVAAELMDWKSKWHAHGKGKSKGSVVSGLGIGIHTWGGAGHNSTCTVKIHPDGAVETFLGSQDIGTGTRTCIGMVVAETLGLPLDAVSVNIGSSAYPASGPSGGSTTIGGVSQSNRRAATDALNELFAKAAGKLGAPAEQLEAADGKIQVKGGGKSISWKEACSLLGTTPIEAQGKYLRGQTEELNISSSGVAGVQMAEVSVDKETGIVRVDKVVAVQDMGLVVNRKTASTQIYGAVIMGIAYALFEERIMDPKTGAFVNAHLADYKLPRLGDIGDIVVELYEPESEYNRGVVGLGEPPVIGIGAAIGNAVCNALGVRVPVMPHTPQRVLNALGKA